MNKSITFLYIKHSNYVLSWKPTIIVNYIKSTRPGAKIGYVIAREGVKDSKSIIFDTLVKM